MSTASGGCVVHVRTGDELPLTPVELQLLARATAEGVDPDDPMLRPVFKKLANLGLLVPAGAMAAPKKDLNLPIEIEEQTVTAPDVPPGPAANAPLPMFRVDLLLARRQGSGLYDVTDPTNGKTFALYDFEVSLARMLDGRRATSDVVEAAGRLGIPANPDSLEQFLRQLGRYGFLAAPGAAPQPPAEGEGGRPARKKWDEGIRSLFQSGMRMSRQGRYPEAVAYFEAILEQDPENPEAVEMLDEVRRRTGAAPTVLVPAAQLPDSQLNAAVPVPRPRPRNYLLMGFGLAAVLVAVVSVVFAVRLASVRAPSGVPPVVAAPAPPPPPAVVPPTPVAAGPVEQPAVPAPAPAPATGAVSTADASAVEASTDAGAGADAATQAVAAAVPEASPKPEPKPEAVAVAAADAGPAGASARTWLEVKPARRGRVTMGVVHLPEAGAVSWTAKEKEAVKRGQTVGNVTAEGHKTGLKAPKDGLLIPVLAEGATGEKDAEAAKVVYFEGYVQATVPEAVPAASWDCEVFDQASNDRAPCKVVTATPGPKGLAVTGTYEPMWFDTCAKPVLRLAPVP